MSVIPYARQSINESDIDSVLEVLRSDWLTQGPIIPKFEQAVAEYCGVRYAVAVSSATAGLHIACQALGLGQGDELWTSPNTFVASANCALYSGADIDFVDIDSGTLNMSSEQLAHKLEAGAVRPKVVVPVHFGGQSCEMDRIGELATSYNFELIEDASHAIGATFKGFPVGACRHSAATVFSFHPVKIMTTGEGGMVLTNREDIYEALLSLRSHGITRDVNKMARQNEGEWYYEQTELGYNYRITDLQSALGLSQLTRIDQFIERRRELAARYVKKLSHLPIEFQLQAEGCNSAWHLFPIRIKKFRGDIDRSKVFARLRSAGIGVNVHYIPVHLQPWYQNMGFCAGQFPESEQYYSEAISLPMYYALSDALQDKVINELTKAYTE